GYVVTDEHQATTADGVFAAGDVCVKPLRQVATAISQAATTATEMERYLKAAQERTGLVPEAPVTRMNTASPQASTPAPGSSQGSPKKAGALFDEGMVAQLNAVFARMANPLVLRLSLDDRPVSQELVGYMEELAKLTEKLSVVVLDESAVEETPAVEVCTSDGVPTGLAFHGVPGGHEFTSFVLGLYNAAGPGQPIDDADRARIAAIDRPIKLQVLVGLSCTMCPEVVMAAQRIAADNAGVTADVYDINHFESLKNRYDVMSVPCLVVDDGKIVTFGKKNLAQILDLIS
ncbi:MAG: thioredoxin family protein, partial [Atopobiaceae bacterium]|nr:thioredoxin family protein [Atopobiaceae bacterium]